MKMWYMHGNKPCTLIDVDFEKKKVAIENKTPYFLEKAFGNNDCPSFSDFERFLESRCVSKNLGNLNKYLKTLGLDEYNAFEIVKKTKGKMVHDSYWLKF